MTQDSYMALDDVQSLWTETLKPWIVDRNSYRDVYIGAAADSSTVIANAYHHDIISKGEPVAVSNASNARIWIVLPSTYSPTVMMNGIEVPMSLDNTTTIGGKSYKIWKSSNIYTGSFNVYLS